LAEVLDEVWAEASVEVWAEALDQVEV